MSKQVWFAAWVMSLGLVGAPAASAADSVYWADASANQIAFANLDGSGGGNLATGSATVSRPRGVAVDLAAGRIYWANTFANKISFANLNGSGGGDLVTSGASVNSPAGVAVDPAGGRIYWANTFGNPISFANLNGSGGSDLSTLGASVNSPTGVAVDPGAGRIYWANSSGNRISFANLNGSGGADLSTLGASVNSPTGVAVDPAAGRIYWANAFGNTISFANVNGSGGGADLSTRGASVNSPAGVAVDQAAGRIYWANAFGSSISFANVNGSGGGDVNTLGASVSTPMFPVLLHPPSGAAAPVVSGSAAVGATLSCSRGAWAADLLPAFDYRAPQSVAFSWSEDGRPFAGPSNSIIASSPGSYTCQVTAANHAGSATQTSAAFIVPRTSGGSRGRSGSQQTTGSRTSGQSKAVLPSLNGLSLSRSSFRVGSGTRVSYTDSKAATTTFTVLRAASGFRRGAHCVARRPAGRRHVRRCTFFHSVGSFSVADKAGRNHFHFTGRVRARNLMPGPYRLQAVPSFGGHKGAARTATFNVVR